jgi:hypothetical protein
MNRIETLICTGASFDIRWMGMADPDSSLEKKVAHKVRAVADKVDITCDRCGKLMKPGGVIKKKIGDEEFQFCSVHCAANFNAKIRKHDETPVWKKHAEEGPSDRSRTMMLVIIVVIAAIVILAAYLVSVALRPTLYSELSVSSDDVDVLASTPSGDNKTAIVPVRVELTNIGELESGVILIRCSAYNLTQENQLASEFNTSSLVAINGSGVKDKISPKGKPGSIVQATGNLVLPPGNYTVRIKIYEDASKKTIVSGSVLIRVDQSMVATLQSAFPGGSGKGRSEAGASLMPGFEGIVVLAVAASMALILRRSRK